MSDFDALQPVRTTALNFTTEVANAAGTTINPSEDYAQGSTTSGQNGVLDQGAVTTSAPTYTTGTTNPLSLDTSGNLRVLSTVSGTVTVVGNLTNNNAAPAANNVGVLSALANAANPTWTEGDQVLLSEDLSGHLRTRDSSDGPVTPGTVAATSILAGGQYNSTPPTLTNGQQVALQVDSSGRLLVDSNATTPTPVLTYFTDSAVASGSTTTHSVAGPVTLDKIDFTASGEMKGTVAIGVTGSEVTYWNGFNSASKQNFEFEMVYPYVIPTGSSVKVTLKNRDTAAQDLYVTFFTH
jgi:hypothetical protein